MKDLNKTTLGWQNRVLLAALAGILFLTLYPFHPQIVGQEAVGRSPFLLGYAVKISWTDQKILAAFLNILLFVPFGFGLTERLRERGWTRRRSMVAVVAAGALLSYSIELAQLYFPPRNSGWGDVITNTCGSATGFILFEILGATALSLLSSCERNLRDWLSPRRTIIVVATFFAVLIPAAMLLAKEAQLASWDPDSFLVVGNGSTGHEPWKGQVSLLEFWDSALPGKLAKRLTGTNALKPISSPPLEMYNFSATHKFEGGKRSRSSLAWTPFIPDRAEKEPLDLDGRSWLVSTTPMVHLVGSIEKSKQFSLRLVCTPAEAIHARGAIVSIAGSRGRTDLTLGQEGSELVFWFRSPVTSGHGYLVWKIPGVFRAGQSNDLLLANDGSGLALFLNGKAEPRTYRLGPGAALAQRFVHVKTGQLNASNDLFYALAFLPPGILWGLSRRNKKRTEVAWWMLFLSTCVVFPLLLEEVLMEQAGRPISVHNLILSWTFLVVGFLWINADGGGKLQKVEASV